MHSPHHLDPQDVRYSTGELEALGMVYCILKSMLPFCIPIDTSCKIIGYHCHKGMHLVWETDSHTNI